AATAARRIITTPPATGSITGTRVGSRSPLSPWASMIRPTRSHSRHCSPTRTVASRTASVGRAVQVGGEIGSGTAGLRGGTVGSDSDPVWRRQDRNPVPRRRHLPAFLSAGGPWYNLPVRPQGIATSAALRRGRANAL